MKIILYILLLLITGIYILPVKGHLGKDAVVCTTDMDTEKEENNKKEKEKELFSYTASYHFKNSFNYNMYGHLSYCIPVPLHTVETPPPDFV
jgi:uncharacterized protein YxeA